MSSKSMILKAVLGVLLLCAVIWCAGCRQAEEPGQAPAAETAQPGETKPAEPTAAPQPSEAADATAAPQAEPTEQAGGQAQDPPSVAYAAGYVRVVSPTVNGWLPLPAEKDYVYPLRQMTADGTIVENHIHLTPRGVYMESATCENQDCVHQGEVTLENKADRALENMIICLPHQVYLELYSTEELLGPSNEQEGAFQ